MFRQTMLKAESHHAATGGLQAGRYTARRRTNLPEQVPTTFAPKPQQMTEKDRKWVLIMDDDAVLRDVTCCMLESAGYGAVATEDGEEAIRNYHTAKESGRRFDVVILDLNIPLGKGGKETIRELRALDPDVRAIVTSGDLSDPAMMDHTAFGFRGVLGKPYSMMQLLQTLQTAMSGLKVAA